MLSVYRTPSGTASSCPIRSGRWSALGRGFVLCISFLLLSTTLFAALVERPIRGRVLNEQGEGMPGVNVVVEGTRIGTLTSATGDFSLNVPDSASTLLFSYIGYQRQTIRIRNQNVLEIRMVADAGQLEEVVVTALGVTREKRALGYAVQEVKGDNLTQARETNLINSLAGKVAGVNVTGGSNSIGGSSRIVIRGETSLAGDNQPLFVVDGIPINNGVSASSQRQNIDYGNGAAEINPDDIETISVLKGPNAAALYGSRAANGVILITTKSGKNKKGVGVSVNSTTSFESVLRLPDYQNEYGQGRGDQYNIGDGGRSWGPRLDGRMIAVPVNTEWPPRNGEMVPWVPYPDNVKEFYEVGRTLTNNIALTAGNDNGNFRLSYTNLNQTGIVPNTDQQRHTASITGKYALTNKLNISTGVNYFYTVSNNRPVLSYGNESIVYTWIWEGRQVRTDKMRDYWVKGLEGTQPFTYNYQFNDNPYYTMYENLNGLLRNRLTGNITATYQFTPELSLLVRTGMDMSNERADRRRTFGSNAFPLGMYSQDRDYFEERNSDFLLTYDKTLSSDWQFKVSVGGNQMRQRRDELSTRANALSVPGVYNLGNSQVPLVNIQSDSRYRINSLYSFGQVSYKNALFLDLTARNDWSSTLPVGNNSYFYPSVATSAVLTDLIEGLRTQTLSFAKLRVGWARVGNDTDPYRLRNVYNYNTPWQSNQAVSESSVINNANLKPESVDTYEIGTDIRFFNNRLGLDVTYYNTVSRNQIINIPLDQTSGYTSRFLNAGEIRSRGLEVVLNATPVKLSNGFRWDVALNWATNRARVVELIDGLDTYSLPSRYVSVQARVGGRMGDMYGRGFLRDPQGNIIHADGLPLFTNELIKVGNYNPDWTGGLYNTFTYKGFTLGGLLDMRKGGSIYSYMYVRGNEAGQLVESLPGRENGYVGPGVIRNPDGTFRPNDVNVTAERYWGSGYFNPEQATFDATFLKLRELKFGYQVPNRWLTRLPFRDVNILLVGRNLFLWTKVPHIDPDTTGISGDTLLPGIEDMSMPSARSIGFNINFRL
ncbi:SusC/RagA family TonB-linked outer membrane protein [Fibrisoma montanum]|uniref:SusC/RagA family TonB-linked outer membrane protein n=1 Tax=Fibrisoma montanum TaxID=2305895 RepID=A0A418MAH9_9BACT|nr:SusC/RagA family TonB-linked outer membrane protein [Fibrisoma montanum]RIV23387.1 SusC/RagA family TonB-linked outer membrane protein [Fibrisoma montanum]